MHKSKTNIFHGFDFLHVVSAWISHNRRCIKSYMGRFEKNRILATSVGGLMYYKSRRPNPVHDLFPKHIFVLICVLSFGKKYIRMLKLCWFLCRNQQFSGFLLKAPSIRTTMWAQTWNCYVILGPLCSGHHISKFGPIENLSWSIEKKMLYTEGIWRAVSNDSFTSLYEQKMQNRM